MHKNFPSEASSQADRDHIVYNYVKLLALVRGSVTKNYLASQLFDEYEADPEEQDAKIDSCFLDLKERLKYYKIPPYTIDGNIISSNLESWKDFPEYIMCLLFAGYSMPSGTESEARKLFENVISEFFRSFMDCKVIPTGFRDNTLKNQIESICESLHIPGHENIKNNIPDDKKDGGVDVIAFKDFEDGRPNKLIVLSDCATGFNWQGKKCRLIASKWNEWFSGNLHTAISSVAIPHLFIYREREHKNYLDTTQDNGLLIDRARIYNAMLSMSPTAEYSNVRAKVIDWCQKKMEEYEIY